MNERVPFLVFFLTVGFVAKIVVEAVHEIVGHGLLILLSGGNIVSIYIALLWPYELSHVTYSLPQGGFGFWQKPWIDGGGILICIILFTLLQGMLLLKITKDWRFAIFPFWLSFWLFLNFTGYLVVGGVQPFGDVQQLIADGILTQMLAVSGGLLLFPLGFFSLSRVLGEILLDANMVNSDQSLRMSMTIFWLQVPVIAVAAFIGLKFLANIPLVLVASFIPSIIAFEVGSSAVSLGFKKKQENSNRQDLKNNRDTEEDIT